MWLSNTPVLTYGLLIVHVSVVSCLNYRFGPAPRTSSYGFGRTPTFTPASNKGMMSSTELLAKYGGVKIDEQDAIEKAMKMHFKQPGQTSPQPSMNRYPSGPTLTSADLLQRYGASIDFDARPSVVIAKQTDERPPYQSLGDWSQYNPNNPTRRPTSPSSYSQYGSNRYTGYTPYRYTPEPEANPAYSGFGTFSPFRQSETQYRQPVPSRGQVPPPRSSSGRMGSFSGTSSSDDFENMLQSAIAPTSNATPAPSRAPAPTPRSSSGRMGSFSGTSSSDDFENMLRSAISPTSNARPASPRVPAPPPRTTSSTSNGMGSSLPADNPSDSPPKLPSKNKRKIFSEIDGRRLDGRQTQEWPQLGGYYRIVDAGNYLGSDFKGVLIPMSFINHVSNNLERMKQESTANKAAGVGRPCQFSLEIESRAYNDFDVDMFHQAVREVQGDFDDYDNPDPWTYATTYSKEVLDYNRELHNYYRAKHYAGPLEYMDMIHPESHAYAVKMAKYLSDTSVENLDHNFALLDRNMWSENLYADTSSFDGRAPAMVVKRAVDSFYEEIDLWNNQYNMKHPNVQDPVTGHFTCLVWRSSKRMGMGLAKYRNNERNKTTYVAVFNYDPRGNVQGAYDSNVLEPHAYDDGRPLPKAICPYPSKFVNDTNYD